MIFNKLFAFLFIVGLFVQTTSAITPTPTPAVKRAELTPELKQNALNLLSQVARETRQFKLAENRARARTIIADLMWRHDEREARAVYQKSLVELRKLLDQIDAARYAELSGEKKSDHYVRRVRLAELRREFLLMLAAHDPAGAIAALPGLLQTKKIGEYDPLEATELRLQLAVVIAAAAGRDPDRAYALFKEQFGASGITLEFIEALKYLHEKNSRLAAIISKDVFAFVKTAKIGTLPAGGGGTPKPVANANSAAARSKQAEIDFWQVTAFINAASEMNRRAARDKEKKVLPALSEAEMKELAETIAHAFLTASNPEKFSISQAMTEITRYAPAEAKRIRLKVSAETSRSYDNVMESDAYYRSLEEKNADQLAREAEGTHAPDKRELLFAESVRKALVDNDPVKAQTIAARIKDRKNYAQLFEEINAALPLAAARRGQTEEVRKLLVRMKTKQEKTAVLTELASALHAKGDDETAKKLLDEALRMTPAAAFGKQPDLESAAKIAAVYSTVVPEQAFTMIETGIEGMNRHLRAGIKGDEFHGSGATETDELHYDRMERGLLLYAPQTIDLLKNLARANFDRTVKLADRFERPEIRLFTRLRVLQSLLDPEAAEKEQKTRERIIAEEEEGP